MAVPMGSELQSQPQSGPPPQETGPQKSIFATMTKSLSDETVTNRTNWNLDFPFADGPLRLRMIRPEHAVSAGQEYTAAQSARIQLPQLQQRTVAQGSGGRIRRIWIWGKLMQRFALIATKSSPGLG